MPALHKDHNIHLDILLKIIEKKTINLSDIYSTVVKDVILKVYFNLDKFDKKDRKVRLKNRIASLLRDLIRKKLIIKIKKQDELDIYSITDEGREVLKGEKLLKLTKGGKKLKNKDLLIQPKEIKYLSWTDPVFNEKNNRWEFFQLNQDEEVMEIMHSESEEEIRKMHYKKQSAHIMAAMHNPDKDKNKAITIQDVGKYGNKHIGEPKTPGYIKIQCMADMIKMKMEGVEYNEMANKIRKEYNLTLMTVTLYYTEALEQLREKRFELAQKIVENNILRYEEFYRWFMENGYDKYALMVLTRKEKLMGLHDTENVDPMLYNSLDNNNLSKKKYDWSLITEEERERLRFLIRKMMPKKENDKNKK